LNIFEFSAPTTGERFDTLFENEKVRIVRIVSSDKVEPELYIQQEDEWVVVLEGEATLDMDGEQIRLGKGDTLFIPAGTPHRVTSTAKGTLWLAVHIY